MSEFLFVYGTLRRGGTNHRWLASAPYVGPAVTVAWCGLYVDDYPYLNPNHPVGPVAGEVFKVSHAMLKRLDEFEGVPLLYSRDRLAVLVEGLGALDAWTYVRAARSGRLLEHGDFSHETVG